MKGHTYVAKTPDKNGFVDYTDEENETWQTLYQRQRKIVENRACDEFIQGLDILEFSDSAIPQLPDVNKRLDECTGWGVEPVTAVISAEKFFTLLASKRFPAATFIRIPEELDYLQEPDIFHELFGHCPLITNKSYADFLEAYGKMALTATGRQRSRLFRLFWFTIEFGILKKNDQYNVYGGGILSSKEETVYSVESDIPVRQKLDPLTAMRTPFRIDIIQPLYYWIESLEEIYHIMDKNLISLVDESIKLGTLDPLFATKEEITPKKEMSFC